MVKESMDLLELLRKRGVDGDVDFLREALRVLMDAIMDAEVSARIGAEHGERSPDRLTYRNGYRSRAWDTRVGTMELRIPKLREGSYFPSLLEPRRRSEKALLAVIQQAYVEGVSTRRVDDLVKALGCEGISKSQVSRICGELDRVVDSFLDRPLDGGAYCYLWLDALSQKVREEGRTEFCSLRFRPVATRWLPSASAAPIGIPHLRGAGARLVQSRIHKGGRAASRALPQASSTHPSDIPPLSVQVHTILFQTSHPSASTA